jgi:hypothetical protein
MTERGQYQGKDGRPWDVCGVQVRTDGSLVDRKTIVPGDADYDLALAALAELKEDGEWVEFGVGMRCNESMTRFQELYQYEPLWRDTEPDTIASAEAGAYLRGRESGLAQGRKENEALREAVELASEVLNAEAMLGSLTVRPASPAPFGKSLVSAAWVNRIVALAKQVTR